MRSLISILVYLSVGIQGVYTQDTGPCGNIHLGLNSEAMAGSNCDRGNVNDICAATCKPGYKVTTGEGDDPLPSVCTSSGWNPAEMNGCQEIECEPPTSEIGHTLHANVYIYGELCVVQCTSGYRRARKQVSASVCSDDGTWQPAIDDICIPLDCGLVPDIPGLKIKGANLYETFYRGNGASVECMEGYEGTGTSMQITCTVDGTWGSSAGKTLSEYCPRVNCGTPSLPSSNAPTQLYSQGKEYKDVAIYECLQGFVRQTQQIRCGSDGLWSPAVLPCTPEVEPVCASGHNTSYDSAVLLFVGIFYLLARNQCA